MSKTLKIALICFATNLLFVALLIALQNREGSFISIGLLWLFYLGVQFLAGIILVFRETTREWGKGLLLGALLGLVVGFSICSTAVR
jgi:hypothetical protein